MLNSLLFLKEGLPLPSSLVSLRLVRDGTVDAHTQLNLWNARSPSQLTIFRDIFEYSALVRVNITALLRWLGALTMTFLCCAAAAPYLVPGGP